MFRSSKDTIELLEMCLYSKQHKNLTDNKTREIIHKIYGLLCSRYQRNLREKIKDNDLFFYYIDKLQF